MNAKPAASLQGLAIACALLGLAVAAGCARVPVQVDTIDPVIASAPRAPLEGRDPRDRLLMVSGEGRRQALIDTLGRIVVEPEFNWTSSSSEGRARVERGGLAGFVDGTGRIVIEPAWQEAGSFNEGLAMVATGIKYHQGRLVWQEGGTRGYIDRDGKVVIAPRFADAKPFSEGVAWVRDGERWGLIDRTGEYLIQPRFQIVGAWGFSSGVCPVWVGRVLEATTDGERMRDDDDSLGYWVYVDTAGAVAIPGRFREAGSFSEGLAAIVRGGKVGFIDRAGQMRIEPRFEWSRRQRLPAFSEGLAPVQVGGGLGFIDTTGRIAIEPRYGRDELSELSNRAGPPAEMRFSDGLAAVSVNGKTGFIDRGGRMMIAPQFRSVDPFEDGIARVEVFAPQNMGRRFGYIHRDGSLIWNPLVAHKHGTDSLP